MRSGAAISTMVLAKQLKTFQNPFRKMKSEEYRAMDDQSSKTKKTRMQYIKQERSEEKTLDDKGCACNKAGAANCQGDETKDRMRSDRRMAVSSIELKTIQYVKRLCLHKNLQIVGLI